MLAVKCNECCHVRKGPIMKSMLSIPPILFILFFFAQLVPAQDFFVFPGQGQSQEQMDRDKVECQIWARQQTGFDPLARPRATEPPPAREAPQGGLARGAVRGAAVGVVGGAIAGDAGRGAAIGAGTGALVGGMRTIGPGQKGTGSSAAMGAAAGRPAFSGPRPVRPRIQGVSGGQRV